MQQQARLPAENIYGHTKKLRFIIDQVDRYLAAHGAPVTLLDFGCGNGSAVSQFLMRPGVEYYGVDIHEPSLRYAREHFGGPHARFLDAPPEGVEFDLLVYSDILEHLDDPVGFLKQHYPLLKPGGILAGSVPNGYGPFENEKRVDQVLHLTGAYNFALNLKHKMAGRTPAAGDAPAAIPYNAESGHVQFFTRGALVRTIQAAGFRDVRLAKGTFAGSPVSSLFLRPGEKMARLNARVADFLPYWALSTWYFTATK